MSYKIICLLAVSACLINVHQVVNASLFHPCPGFNNFTIKVDQCPDTSAEQCVLKFGQDVKYELEFVSGK